jgi:acetyl-CoA carboxylase biotin carboxyl carrier protein
LSEKKTSRKNVAGPSATTPRGPMNVGLLEELVKLMAANDLNTIDVRDGEKRIILKRGAPAPIMMATSIQAAHAPPSPASSSSSGKAPAAASDDTAGLIPIKSPMVGTFYSKPAPDARPFVNVGSVVTEETDVCVIEAMKVFNNIKAECRGTIAKIMCQDGETVDFGKVLFLVKP